MDDFKQGSEEIFKVFMRRYLEDCGYTDITCDDLLFSGKKDGKEYTQIRFSQMELNRRHFVDGTPQYTSVSLMFIGDPNEIKEERKSYTKMPVKE